MSNEIYQTSSRVDINLDNIHSRITHLYPGSHHDSNKEQFLLDRRNLEPGVDWGLKERERIEKLNRIEQNSDSCDKNDESKAKPESDNRLWPMQAHQTNRHELRHQEQVDCHESEIQATNLSCDGSKIENNINNSEVKRENAEPIRQCTVSDSQTVITSPVCKAENTIYSHQNYVPIKTEPFQEFVQKYERPEFNYPPPPVQYLNNQNYYYDNYPPQIPHSSVYNTYNPPAPPAPQQSPVLQTIATKSKSSSRSSNNSSPTESQLLRLQRHRDSQALRRLNPDYRRAEQEADRQRKRVRRSNPDYRRLENARNSMRNRIRRSDPIYRAAEQKVDAIRKRLKRNDPEYRKKEQERNNIRNRIRRMDPEYREAERIRSANRKRIKRSDPEYRKREQELDRERKKRKKQMKREHQQNSSNSEETEIHQIPTDNITNQNYSNQSINAAITTSNVIESKSNNHEHEHEQHHLHPHPHSHHNHPITATYQPTLPPPPHTQCSDDLKLKLLKIGERQFPIPPPISHIYSLQRNFMENCGFHPAPPPPLPVTHQHHHLHGANTVTTAVAAASVNRHNFRNFDGKIIILNMN